MIKFKSQVWQLFIHASMAVLEFVVWSQMTDAFGDLFSQPWLCSDFYSKDVPLLTTLYLVQMAIWVVTCYFHCFVFETQSDYFVMLAHHLATIALVGLSLRFNFTRMGLMVLILHDISDIPIDLLKLFNYLKLEERAGFSLVEGIFTINLFSWVYLRFYCFLVKVIYGAACKLMGTYHALSYGYTLDEALSKGYIYSEGFFGSYGDEGRKASQKVVDNLLHYITSVNNASQANAEFYETEYTVWCAGNLAIALLCLLFLMHVWWFFLFLRILYGIITVGGHEAGRQQYEGDDNVDGGDNAEQPSKKD